MRCSVVTDSLETTCGCVELKYKIKSLAYLHINHTGLLPYKSLAYLPTMHSYSFINWLIIQLSVHIIPDFFWCYCLLVYLNWSCNAQAFYKTLSEEYEINCGDIVLHSSFRRLSFGKMQDRSTGKILGSNWKSPGSDLPWGQGGWTSCFFLWPPYFQPLTDPKGARLDPLKFTTHSTHQTTQ